jgi:hypothetical protein
MKSVAEERKQDYFRGKVNRAKTWSFISNEDLLNSMKSESFRDE